MSTGAKPQSKKTVDDEAPLDKVLTATEQMMMRADLAQMRMENEMISAECRMHPRNMKEVRDKLSELLEEFPDFADEAIYCKPVGREEGSDKQKFARGLSIRAAEALAEVYGYSRVRADVSKIDDFTVKIDATFTDFQSGRIWQDGGMVSKFYTSRNKQRLTHSDDRFYNVVIKAEKSKYIREVICRSVNSALKAWFESACQKVAESRLSEEDINKTLTTWKSIGVMLEHLEAALGKQLAMGWTNEDRLVLRGIWTAIKDGETTVKEAFGIEKPETKPPKAASTGPVQASDLTAPKQAIPIDELFVRYQTAVLACDVTKDVTETYNKYFGEGGMAAWTPEHATAAVELRDKAIAAIKAGRGGKKQGELVK